MPADAAGCAPARPARRAAARPAPLSRPVPGPLAALSTAQRYRASAGRGHLPAAIASTPSWRSPGAIGLSGTSTHSPCASALTSPIGVSPSSTRTRSPGKGAAGNHGLAALIDRHDVKTGHAGAMRSAGDAGAGAHPGIRRLSRQRLLPPFAAGDPIRPPRYRPSSSNHREQQRDRPPRRTRRRPATTVGLAEVSRASPQPYSRSRRACNAASHNRLRNDLAEGFYNERQQFR